MKKRILVVDDEEYMHRLMGHHLLRAGYEIITARNGLEAIHKAKGECPELVLMDVMMPEMDGLAALTELKRCEPTRSIPVIMLTTNARTLTKEEAEASGAAAFFTKPFSPTQLLLEVKRLLPSATVS